jgi:hypothetical protein
VSLWESGQGARVQATNDAGNGGDTFRRDAIVPKLPPLPGLRSTSELSHPAGDARVQVDFPSSSGGNRGGCNVWFGSFKFSIHFSAARDEG